ncbi:MULTISPECIES: V-type ATP synthase subunit I [Anaerotruncus]|uniref:V-type ATP synthase subunit I n=2 Tax=Anaerotruncus TaxID=244127 RepID=A0A498CTF1_9FIRM|nr:MULTISPECIES: V-type ATP synthase subunit I [Anaerotruncus]MBC3937300.1 V-type ATP synthase subunit I [Anaerotruncus massiliensis (ex Togo et al. 2019)]MCQ4895353.1 V-type ATP synthase subunit I [Anaerotruncus sp. DFI.9.16]RLL14432.1 V-type ATP synthase subunit I [Anaerotruncus massiliensis (ex Liu et al. 2021)]
MAVLQMQRISICALKKDRKSILEALQRRGVVEISDLALQDSVFEKADTSAVRSQFEKDLSAVNQALEVLDAYSPVKSSLLSSLEGRGPLTADEYAAFGERADDVLAQALRLNALSKKIAENRAEILKLETQLDALVPWLGLDVPLRFTGTRSTAAFIGSFPEDLSLDEVYSRIAGQAPDATVNVDLVSHSQDQTCVFIVAPRAEAAAVDEALRAIGFTRPASPPAESPAERKKLLEAEVAQANEAIEAARTEIVSRGGDRPDLKLLADYLRLRAEKYDVIGRLMQSRRAFILSGYVTARNARPLSEELSSKFDVAVELTAPDPDEDVPVVLKNNPFSTPVESVVESYSLPGRHEIDPTTIMSFFYYILFGMMLSDAGYGLVMTIACAVVILKYKNMEPGIGKMVKMFFWCGLSTTFWGFMFGSFFGDAVAVISSTFFHSDLALRPIWFEPVSEPIRLLTFSFLIGIIHLFVGLGLKFYQYAREGKYYDAVCDVVFWYLLVGGGIVYLLTMPMITEMLGIPFQLPPIAATVAAWCALAGLVGIILTGGRDSKNPFARLAQGLYSAYNVTGYLSDILSYSRLLALGLATGVIAQVFNKMGSMAGGGIVGAIMFIIVFLIGHTLNIGINLLGAYVHTNRLQFVEFFGKFYEGGGRAFTPFAAHTKYYKFKEEI